MKTGRFNSEPPHVLMELDSEYCADAREHGIHCLRGGGDDIRGFSCYKIDSPQLFDANISLSIFIIRQAHMHWVAVID